MRKVIGTVLPLLVVLGFASPGYGQRSQSAREAIRGTETRIVKAFLNNDWKALATLYAEDAVLMPPNAPPVKGNQHIAEFFAAGGLNISKFEVSSEGILTDTEIATNRGSYSLTFTMPGTTAPLTDHGKYLWILRRSPDGVWRIAIDMFSSNQPLPSPGK